MKIKSLSYFECVARSSKAFIAIALFWSFWISQIILSGGNFSIIDDLILWLLSPILIFCLFFLGYKQAARLNQDSNFLYYAGTLTELMIFLNRSGFNLKEQIGDYYLMHSRFPLQHYKQIAVKSQGTECIVFGDILLIKMLETDLIALKKVYTTKAT